jgi:putative ABC transport system substrate-binding protein
MSGREHFILPRAAGEDESRRLPRRSFLALVASAAIDAALAVPRVARAQQSTMPIIGILDSSSRDARQGALAALRSGLQELGYVDGRNVAFEYRYAENHYDRLPALAADLVRRHVAVIVVNNVPARAAKAATATIPIVFVSGGDPVMEGLVKSISRPEGNVTGISFLSQSTLVAKRIELLRELVPKVATIGYLMNPKSPNGDIEKAEIQAAAHSIGQQVRALEAASERDLDAAFARLTQEGVGALLVGGDAFFTSERKRLVALAARHAIPTIYQLRDFVMAGGLISYGASLTDAWRHAGVYVGRILKGAKPADLPVMLPTRFELVINLKAAKALGLTVPLTLQTSADEVIE